MLQQDNRTNPVKTKEYDNASNLLTLKTIGRRTARLGYLLLSPPKAGHVLAFFYDPLLPFHACSDCGCPNHVENGMLLCTWNTSDEVGLFWNLTRIQDASNRYQSQTH